MLTTISFLDTLNKFAVPNDEVIFGIACSGGVDSMALAHIMHNANLPILLLHCNFGLRGAASDADAAFVTKFAAEHNINCLIKKMDTQLFATENKITIQEAARQLRYNWFVETLNSQKAKHKYLCTAHHKDDNAETILFNFLRGATIKGLQGIPENYALGDINVVRPFLHQSKLALKNYCEANIIHWVEDASNQTTKYDRNFLRHEILPNIYARNENAQEKILGSVNRFKQYEATINYHANHLEDLLAFKKIGKINLVNEVALPIKKMQKLGLPYCFAYLEKLGFGYNQLPEIEKLFNTTNGKYLKASNENKGLYKYNNWLIYKSLEAPIDEEEQHFILEQSSQGVETNSLILKMALMDKDVLTINKNSQEAFLDAKNIVWPLIVRRAKEGDYFYPLGMPKKKKLSRFFIDEKVPKEKRTQIWVIESDRKIIWVVGMRINDKFKINENTKEVLHFYITAKV